jgi:hypothetical protein
MHLRDALCFSCLVVCLGGSHVAHADGKLAQARREASSDDSDKRSDTSSHQRQRGHSRHHDDCSQGFVEALICGLLGCSDSCSSGEVEVEVDGVAYASEEPAAPPLTYARYPYASPLAPYLLEPELQVASTSSELDLQLHRERPIGRPYAGQLGLDAGYLDGIAHSGFEARVLTPTPFEFGARHRFMYEPSAGDYALFGAADLGVRFASLPVLLMRVFAGPLYFGKPGEMVVGGEVGVGIELFLGRPWVLSARVAGGVLQNDLLLPQARVQLGYLLGRAELFVGYDYLQIGSVDLGTPIFGTRIWL